MVQVYTGNGKGKTTAAIGIAVRARGAGIKVFMAQFVKSSKCSESKVLARLGVRVKQYGSGFIKGRPDQRALERGRTGLVEVTKALRSGRYGLVILDEANVAVKYGVLDFKDLLRVITKRQKDVEVVITGRYAHPKVLKAADLVTEMKEVKHYYKKGLKARRGIEF